MIIKTRAFPRAGLVGNPSDGYYGKTISFAFRNFCAEVVLYQTPELEILPSERDQSCFGSVKDLVQDVQLYGYYGGIRLLKATIKRFFEYCRENRIILDDRNFTIRYNSNIPHQVGLAGSSAIITACMRALTAFYQIDIPRPIKANLILSVENEELGISAGLQDRVIQVYEGLVYMDFDRDYMERHGYGFYEELNPKSLPPLYIAYRADLSEGSEVFHNNIRDRFDRGDKPVVSAMKYWAGLTDKVKACLMDGRAKEIGKLLDANFDRRKKLYKLGDDNLKMVDAARSVGASAKFTGSGGAIVGTYSDAKMLTKLKKRMGELNIKVIRPMVVTRKERIKL